MITIQTTEGVPESKRFAVWRNIISDSFVPLDCEQTSSIPFIGEIATVVIRDFSFLTIRGSDYKVVRTPRQITGDRKHKVMITLQRRGSCYLAQDGREVQLQAGDFACCDTTRPYTAMVSHDFELVSICVPRDKWIRRLGHTEMLTARAVPGNTEAGALVSDFVGQFVSIAERLTPQASQRFSDVSLSLVSGALSDLVTQQQASQHVGRTALLYRAKALIEEHLQHPELDRETVARMLGISVRYLQDLFQQENLTVCEWIWSRRLENCRRDLSDPLLSGKSIGQIASDNGFVEFSHFSRRFKAAYHETASDFRRRQNQIKQARH